MGEEYEKDESLENSLDMKKIMITKCKKTKQIQKMFQGNIGEAASKCSHDLSYQENSKMKKFKPRRVAYKRRRYLSCARKVLESITYENHILRYRLCTVGLSKRLLDKKLLKLTQSQKMTSKKSRHKHSPKKHHHVRKTRSSQHISKPMRELSKAKFA
jgi:hypothetical protein